MFINEAQAKLLEIAERLEEKVSDDSPMCESLPRKKEAQQIREIALKLKNNYPIRHPGGDLGDGYM